MYIKSLTIRNFGPYGNIPQNIQFSNLAELIYVIAKNGSGKSTIINAIIYALYGTVPGLTLDDLINRINKKNLEVEIIFEVNNRCIEIKRGIKPTRFILIVDGVEDERAGKPALQKFIETELLKIPLKIFSNLIALSIKDFKSFITMTPLDKREIIDKMFGLDIINVIKKTLSNQRNLITSDVDKTQQRIQEKIELMRGVNEKLLKIKDVDDKQLLKKVELLTTEIQDINVNKEKKADNLKKINLKLSEIQTETNEQKIKLNSFLSDYNKKDKELELYKNKKCPTCQNDLTTDYHIGLKKQIENEKQQIKITATEIRSTILALTEKINKCQEFKSNVEKEHNNILNRLNQCKTELNYTKNNQGKKDKHIEEFELLVKHAEKDINGFNETLNNLKDDLNYYNLMVDSIFSEGGVKAELTRKIINPLNDLIQQNLKEYNYDKQIIFDENFVVKVKHLGMEVNPKTLSEGERKMADTSIVFSFTELMLLQFPKLNMLFLDELLSSLDPENINITLMLIKKLTKKFNMNIFIVSHDLIEQQIFDKIISIKKTNSMSIINFQDIK